MLHSKKKWHLPSTNEERTPTSAEGTIQVDLTCKLSDLNPVTITNTLTTGQIVLLLGVEIKEYRTIGDQHQHLKMTIVQEEVSMECVGYDMGYLVQEVTPNAVANMVGEPVLREWNGKAKMQLIIEDFEIPEMQIFDFRESRDKQSKLVHIVNPETMILCFRENSVLELMRMHHVIEAGIFHVKEELDHSVISDSHLMYSSVVLYDTPYSMEQFNYGLTIVSKPERIYCLFGDEYKDRLAVLPRREHFKWLYAMFHKYGKISHALLPELAKSGNLGEHAVHFMILVFLDLGFIEQTDEDYMISLTPVRRELAESKVYRRKKNELDLETEILYSSYAFLCKVIKQVTL